MTNRQLKKSKTNETPSGEILVASATPATEAPPMPTKVKPTVIKVKNRHGFARFPGIMVALVIMAAMSYVIKENPILQEKYPTIFWFADLYLKVAEFGFRIGKLIVNAIGDLLNLIRTGSCNFGENISVNWHSIVEAFEIMLGSFV